MTWQTIAKKDVRAVGDSRLFRYVLGFVVFAYLVGGYLVPTVIDSPATADLPRYVSTAVTLLVPLTAILLGYKAIVDERASGRLVLLLSLPHSRRDVLVGTFVGRALVLVGTLVAGVAVATALVAYPFGSFQPVDFLVYLGATILLGLAFLSIALAISAFTESSSIATAVAFGVFFLFVVVWSELRILFRLGLDSLGMGSDELPAWALFVHGLEPSACYERVVGGFVEHSTTGMYLHPDAPWYLGEEVALVALVAWVILPVTMGYVRFRGSDL
ncbi:ABC transporter [Salinarchaeum sp. Harcht-Bsk1]|uniref:ABC transporter permease n=1 Tax=Salinarchaeum sp. Harcht-Bsk1 TaxID=1333523 RepID=UPI0003423077|nr:ABC transporter permease subunit [Salinarchaeum sp. Harcht-Bsk1]AGN02833.1 ABC transporter [Salinarchaeum sp. Harcht-Bsk1]